MIADISHDLRTPLTAIKGYQQLLASEELTKKQREKLDTAGKHTEELDQLIERFFEYSYLLNSEPILHLETINLTKLITECLISFITVFEEHKLAVCFDEDTPPIHIYADQELTTRIIQNLIRNCIGHSARDIRVSLSREEYAVISFQNPVKASENIDTARIFDRFYTGDKARSHSTGLAIVKLLTERMGGRVSANLNHGILELQVKLITEDPSY